MRRRVAQVAGWTVAGCFAHRTARSTVTCDARSRRANLAESSKQRLTSTILYPSACRRATYSCTALAKVLIVGRLATAGRRFATYVDRPWHRVRSCRDVDAAESRPPRPRIRLAEADSSRA